MDIRQAALGAGVAAFLVLGAGAGPERQGVSAVQASSSASVCDLAGMKAALRSAAERIGDAALDTVLDAAGELWACTKQVF